MLGFIKKEAYSMESFFLMQTALFLLYQTAPQVNTAFTQKNILNCYIHKKQPNFTDIGNFSLA
jgi:hypothetical protein